MKLNRFRAGPLCGCLAALALVAGAEAQESSSEKKFPQPVDLTNATLDELINIEVGTPSRVPQPVSQVAAAIHVITQEDIRRSGATTIAEALRMAPGLDVARIDSSRWAISSRGFNDFFANKLLVLMDGRSVYTPLFSGVYWDVQDTLLDDIAQIEVIRGPGAAMWGANAVNGVINIITKNSADTQGTLINAGGGSEEQGFGSVRYGGKIKEGLTYRAYVKYFNRDDFKQLNGGPDGADEWDMYRGGFRTDWQISDQNSLRVQGDLYSGTVGQAIDITSATSLVSGKFEGRGEVAGGNVLSSYQQTFSETSDLTLQLYFDRTERTDLASREIRNTYDLDFQHRFGLPRQELLWGFGYRLTTDELSDGVAGQNSLRFTDPERNDQLFSAFAQDVITVHPDDLKFTLGAKLEHNSYTGFEIQPNARLVWEPNADNTVWAAVSRAVRTPARFEHTLDAYFSQGAFAGGILGDPMYDSEELIAYELGYRVKVSSRVSLDLALFYNDYNDLRVFDFVGIRPVPPPRFGIPIFSPSNAMTGETYGGELAVNWRVCRNWRLFASYTALDMQLHGKTAAGIFPEAAEGESPHHQLQLRSYYDLPFNLQLDGSVSYVDALPTRGVPNYTRVDLRLGWRPCESFELSIVGQNLLDDRHPEFGPGFLVNPNEIERSVYAKATWRF